MAFSYECNIKKHSCYDFFGSFLNLCFEVDHFCVLESVGHVLRLWTFHTSLAKPKDLHLLKVFQVQSFLWEERLWEIQNSFLGKRWENMTFLKGHSGCILCTCSKVKMLNTRSVSPLTLRLKLEYCLTKKNEEIVETCSVLKILQIKIETTNTQLAMTSHLRSTIRQFLLDQNIWKNLIPSHLRQFSVCSISRTLKTVMPYVGFAHKVIHVSGN